MDSIAPQAVITCGACGRRHLEQKHLSQQSCPVCGGAPIAFDDVVHVAIRLPRSASLPEQTYAKRPYWKSMDGPGRPTAAGAPAIAEAA